MTNLLNELKTMQGETTGVKNDVINWLLEDIENYSPQDKLQDLLQYGCESGQVSHLIYYKDTVAYYEKHMDAIQEYASNIMMYDNDPMELNTQDKNHLAWAIFEHNASVLFDELDEMELID